MKMNKIAFLAAYVCSMGLVANAQTTTITDGQITHVMKTANEGEIDLAKVAKSKADNKEVKEFAKMMIDEHKKNEKQDKEVAKKSKIELVDNDMSKLLKDSTSLKVKDLKKLKGAEFDKSYIDQQIAMHQSLLDDLNQKLIPAAQHPELKSYLEETRTHVQEHLTRAQQIQETLKK